MTFLEIEIVRYITTLIGLVLKWVKQARVRGIISL